MAQLLWGPHRSESRSVSLRMSGGAAVFGWPISPPRHHSSQGGCPRTPAPPPAPPWEPHTSCSPASEKHWALEGLTRDRLSSSGPHASCCRVLPMMEGSLSRSGQLRVPSLEGQHTTLWGTTRVEGTRVHTQPQGCTWGRAPGLCLLWSLTFLSHPAVTGFSHVQKRPAGDAEGLRGLGHPGPPTPSTGRPKS